MRPRIAGAVLLTDRSARVSDLYETTLGWALDVYREERSAVGMFRGSQGGVEALVLADDGGPGWRPLVASQDPSALIDRVRDRGAGIRPLRDGFSVLADPFGSEVVVVGEHELSEAFGEQWRWYEPDHTRQGGVSWMQLNTTDPDGAAEFYAQAFGWTRIASDNDKFTYWRFQRDGEVHAGMMAIDERSGAVPAMWQVYFHVRSPSVTLSEVTKAGGAVVVEATEIIAGSFAVAADTAGHVFGIDHMAHDPIPESPA